jgi:hypothetical protein
VAAVVVVLVVVVVAVVQCSVAQLNAQMWSQRGVLFAF